MFNSYMPGDSVKYTGSKFRSEIGSKRGEVVSHVQGEPGAVVVDFGETYILKSSNLARFTQLPTEEKEVVEIVRRRPRDEDEE